MSDETPTPDPVQPPAGTPEPTPAAEVPAAGAPVVPAAAAEVPPAPAPAAAAVTEPQIPVAPVPPVAAPVPPVAAPVPPVAAPVPPVAAPVAPVAAAPPTKTTKAVSVPMWLLASIAALIGAVVMFGVGYAIGDGHSSSNNNAAGRQFPTGNNPFGNQGGGTQQLPNLPNQNGGGTQQLPNLPNQNGGGTQQLPSTPNRGGTGTQNGGGTQQLPTTPNQNGGGTQQTPTPSANAAFLGVAAQQGTGGLEITQVVSGSAADKGGLQVGDVITSFDGTTVSTPAQLSSAVGNLSPGDQAKVVITRNGQTRTVTVQLGSRSASSN